MRTLPAAMFTLLCTAVLPAWSGHEAGHVDMRVSVPHVFQVVVHSQQPTLRVREEDVARGFAEHPHGTGLRFTCNSRAGFSITARYTRPMVKRLVVTFQERRVAIADGETVQFPPCNCQDLPVRVGYRFELAEDARAGLYDWPVELRFDAL